MNVEFELKYRATEAQLQALQAAFPGQVQTIRMETAYYDTPDRALSRRKITLRKRLENGVPVCTLKTPDCKDLGVAGARGEYECQRDDITAAIPELCKLSNMPELHDWTAGGLEYVCGARFVRIAKLLTFPEFAAELALDRGVLTGGGRELPLSEAEVELKSGDPEALREFAQDLAEKYGLVPENSSKFRRALELAKGEN